MERRLRTHARATTTEQYDFMNQTTDHLLNDISYAIYHACAKGLSDISYEYYPPGNPELKETRIRRPHQCDIQVVCFPQMWGSTALGHGGMGGAAMTRANTVVVLMPNHDACVYFGSRLAYHIEHPNDLFTSDMHKHSMHKKDGAKERYEKK